MLKGMILSLAIILSVTNVKAADTACSNSRMLANTAWNECNQVITNNPNFSISPRIVVDTKDVWHIECGDSTGHINYISRSLFSYCTSTSLASGATGNDNPNSCSASGSIIQTSNRVLGESIPLVGSNFDLVYFSNRVIGERQIILLSFHLEELKRMRQFLDIIFKSKMSWIIL